MMMMTRHFKGEQSDEKKASFYDDDEGSAVMMIIQRQFRKSATPCSKSNSSECKHDTGKTITSEEEEKWAKRLRPETDAMCRKGSEV